MKSTLEELAEAREIIADLKSQLRYLKGQMNMRVALILRRYRVSEKLALILDCLMRSAGRVAYYDYICEAVGGNFDRARRSLRVQITRLRAAIVPIEIINVTGVGYMLSSANASLLKAEIGEGTLA
jgi:DNA-binding response OmpR family regulator